MKYTVNEFAKRFRSLVGDSGKSIPNEFIMTAINWAFSDLPTVPKLAKAFSKHYTKNLDAKNHFRWLLNGDYRRIADVPMIRFYTTSGGDPCPLKLCYKPVETFYEINGLVSMKKAGVPCQYTIEFEDDNGYLVLDRPSDVPIIVDYIVYGYPQTVSSMEDEIEISAVIENLLLNTMREVFYTESEDLAFAGVMLDVKSNKFIPEAVQMLNKRLSGEPNIILGGS